MTRLSALAALPCLLFLAWLERNCSLPRLASDGRLSSPAFPLAHLSHWHLGAQLLWDAVLAAGFFHSLRFSLARRPARLWAPGLAALVVIALWQGTGQVIWSLGYSRELVWWGAMAIFWALVALAIRALSRGGGGPFLFYRCLLGASLITPFLSLDRGLFALGFAALALSARKR